MQTPIVFVLGAVPRARELLAYRPMLGVPLFLRGLFTLAQAGFTHFVLVAPAHARRRILKTWEKFSAGRGLHLKLITCRPELRLTGETLAELRKVVAPRFLFIDTNTLMTEQWARESLRPALAHGRPLLGPGRLLTAQELAAWEATLPAEGIRMEKVVGSAVPAIPQRYHSVGNADEWCSGERFLCENIRLATTGMIARHLNKRLSLPLSRPLARLRVHPHIITAFNMLVGLLAGIGTAGRSYWGLLAGAALFQTASILDGCDGEVAKLTHRTSKFGQYIDTISDNVALLSFFTGLLIHLYRVGSVTHALTWAVILFSGIGVLLTMMFRYLRRHTNSASLVTFETEYLGRLTQRRGSPLAAFARTGKFLLKKDCFSIIALAFACVGILPIWLYLASVSVWIGVATLLLLRAQLFRAPSAERAVRRENVDVLS